MGVKDLKVLRQTFLVGLGEFIGPGIGFLVLAYLARVLGVFNFGMINFAQAIFSYGLLLNYLGLPTLGTREIARKKDPAKIVPGILALRFSLSVLGFILIAILGLVLAKNTETKNLIFLYGFSLFLNGLFLDWFYQGKEEMAYLAISRIINYIVYFLFIIMMIHRAGDFYFVPLGFFLANLSVVLFQLFVYQKRFGKIQLITNWEMSKALLKMALPLGVASILIQFNQYLTPTLLGLIKGNLALGYFSAAYKLVTIIAIVDRIFTIVALPMITRYLNSASFVFLPQLIARLQSLLILIVLPITLGGIILASDIVTLVYGVNYAPASSLFRIQIFFFAITIFVSLYGILLIASQKESQYARAIGLGTLTNVTCNPILTFFFAAKGTSIAIVLAETVTLIRLLLTSHYPKTIRASTILKPLFATCLMACFLLLLHWLNIFVRIFLSIIIYSGVLFLINGWRTFRKFVLQR